MRCSTSWRFVAARLEGTVTQWHPYERRGVVRGADGRDYVVPNSRAFETVLPSTIRGGLEGAKVTFRVQALRGSLDDAAASSTLPTDRSVIRRRNDGIHANSYSQTPLKQTDLLAAFRLADDGKLTTTAEPASCNVSLSATEESLGPLPWQRKRSATNERVDTASSTTALAIDIVVDLSTLPKPSEARVKEDEERYYLKEGIRPPSHLKDYRPVSLIDSNKLAQMHRYARASPTEKPVKESMMDCALSASPEKTPPIDTVVKEAHSKGSDATVPSAPSSSAPPKITRTVITAEPLVGTVVAWSSLHRTGLVVRGELPADAVDVPVVSSLENAFVIRSVESFETAMPSSLDLVKRRVRFMAVAYSNVPHQVFAEQIVIEGDLDYSLKITEAPKQTASDAKKLKLAAMVYNEPIVNAQGTSDDLSSRAAVGDPEVPLGAVYGILTRWSGGQGIIERGNGVVYFVQSAAAFLQLVDQHSSSIRGAVVTFEVEPQNPRYAVKVNVLSLAHKDVQSVKPSMPRKDAVVSQQSTTPVAVDAPSSAAVKSARVDDSGAEWLEGFIVSWSPAEEQGVIQGDDGERYLLRDADENVVGYDESMTRHLIKKGRRVKYCRYGGTGLLACHVIALDTEADEAALRAASLQAKADRENQLSIDGNPDEAIASPMSTSYWMTKMERAGFDVSEVKKRQEMAQVPRELQDEDDDPLLSPDEVFKKDRWFNDKDRNIKVPGSDVRVGDLAQVSPIAMVNLAQKVSSPEKLEKMKNKYYNMLSEDMKAHAWQQAKEMAPRYAKRIREARETGQEPTFHFY